MKSLIQQRLALNRDRMASIVTSSFGGIFMLLGIAQLAIGGNSTISWFQIVLGLVALVIGTVTGVRVRRKIRSFEREHGATAGKQTPLK
jgi:cytochrome c oxidase assembly factor CtaG